MNPPEKMNFATDRYQYWSIREQVDMQLITTSTAVQHHSSCEILVRFVYLLLTRHHSQRFPHEFPLGEAQPPL